MAVRSLSVPATAVRGHRVSVTGDLCLTTYVTSRHRTISVSALHTAILPMFDVCRFVICHWWWAAPISITLHPSSLFERQVLVN